MEQKKRIITQDERWQRHYEEMLSFYEEHHRRPSKYRAEEKLRFSWFHQQKKRLSRGTLSPERVERLQYLLEIDQKYRHKNQYE